MLPHPSPERPVGRARRLATFVAPIAAGLLLGAFAGCSTSDCKSMKGSGSFFGDLVCGGQGSDAPEPQAPQPNACTDLHQVMPGFFKLLNDPSQPLSKLRDVVKTIGTPQCAVPKRSCVTSDDCLAGDCGNDGFCPCTQWYNPLADLLEIVFKALAGIAGDKDEPGAVGSRCVSVAVAATLPANQINRLCEVRRMLDVLLQQNGGQKLLDDPDVQKVLMNLIHYIEGAGTGSDGKPHYDLFTTLGRMAQNPSICSPADAYDLLDNALAYYTPQRAASDLGALQDLLSDPQTKAFLKGLSTGNTAQGRASFITLAKDLLGVVTGAQSGEAATSQIDNLLNQVVYPYLQQNYPQTFVDKVKKAVAALEGALSEQAGLFPILQRLLLCLSNPIIDNDGELLGAAYDLISLQDANGGIDLSTLVGALKTLTTLDSTGQVSRSLRLVIEGARDDEDATDAVRSLLAQVLTPDIGQKLLPPLDLLVQNQVLGEVITLLDDLLYKCTPPAPATH
jgi:hypothetical protein